MSTLEFSKPLWIDQKYCSSAEFCAKINMKDKYWCGLLWILWSIVYGVNGIICELSSFTLMQHVPYSRVFCANFLTPVCHSTQERGLKQALLARGSEEDLTCLLDQLGNYKFQHVTHVSNGSDGSALGEPLRWWMLHPSLTDGNVLIFLQFLTLFLCKTICPCSAGKSDVSAIPKSCNSKNCVRVGTAFLGALSCMQVLSVLMVSRSTDIDNCGWIFGAATSSWREYAWVGHFLLNRLWWWVTDGLSFFK